MKKLLQLIMFVGALAVTTGVAAAGSDALDGFKPKTLSVLVQVDDHGGITGISPATELTPPLERLLVRTLEKVIDKPALIDGKPVSSQFVANVVLHATPREGGDYDANFVYVSGSSLPAGSWYWTHDGHRLALADRNMANRQLQENQFAPRSPRRPGSSPDSQPAPPPVKEKLAIR